MRDYKAKMEKYKLSKRRYEQLRKICLSKGIPSRMAVVKAIDKTVDDNLRVWLFRHVTVEDYGWAQMEVDGLPCNRDTFRVYRAKFYWELDKIMKGAAHSGRKSGKTGTKGE